MVQPRFPVPAAAAAAPGRANPLSAPVMSERPTNAPAAGMSLGDIYYILFRHKWKIVIISSAGMLAALLLPLVWPRPYQSEAKVFIKYVVENKSPGQMSANDT